MLNFKELKEIKGDASFRKFYRNENNNSIVVYAKKEKVKNLLNYDAINKILNKNKILAPKLLNQNYENNYIEVEDFGNYKLITASCDDMKIKAKVKKEQDVPSEKVILKFPLERCCIYENNKLI